MRIALLLALVPIILTAQQQSDIVTDASDPFHIKTTVVVSATKSQVDVEKAPVSTSIVTKDELQLRNPLFADQSLNLLEGVLVSRGKGAGDTLTGVGMRGFSGRGTGQSRVLILLDGEPLNNGYTGILTWQTLPVSEIDRIEVARGPFSSLYGGNAMGGVINILTKPVEKRHIEISGRYGSRDLSAYSLSASDRLWNRLGLTFGYDRLQIGGYAPKLVTSTASTGTSGTAVTGAIATSTTSGSRTFIIGDSGNNWWNQHALRARSEYTFSPKTVAFFQFLRQQSQYGYDAYNSYLFDSSGVAIDSGAVTFSDAGTSRRISSLTPYKFMSGPGGGTSNMYNGRIIHTMAGGHRLQLSAGVIDEPTAWYTTPDKTATLASGQGTLSTRPDRAWHADAQWAWDKSSRHHLLFGSEFRRESVTVGEYTLSNYAIMDSKVGQTYSAQGNGLTQAVYGQDQMLLTERLQVIAGGRVDYWRTSDGANNTYGTDLVNNYDARSKTSATGKLSGLYQVAAGTIVRASVGTAFRNPTVYNLYRTWRSSSGTTYSSNPDLKPEELTSWEVGLRQHLGTRVQLESTYYENRVKNLIYLQADDSDSTGKTQIYRNAGKARIRGVEVGVKEHLLSWLQLRESYSFTDAVITKNPAIPASVGKYLTYVPRHQVAGILIGNWKRFSGTLTSRYVSRAYGNDTNSDVTTGVPGSFDPYFEASATFSFQVSRSLSFCAGGDNLLDRYYYQSSYVAPGRTAYIGLRVGL